MTVALLLKELLTGRWCGICDRPIKKGFICQGCWEELRGAVIENFGCFYCGRRSTNGVVCWRCQRKDGLSGGVSLFRYQSKTGRLLHKFKYERQKECARIIEKMIEWWWERVGKKIEIIDYWRRHGFKLTYVPISKRRERWRGFNQAKFIAQVLSGILRLGVWEGIKKTKNTPPRVGLSKRERWLSVRGCFEVIKPTEGVSGVVVVDDVITTGATLKEMGRVLKKSGIKEVWFLSLLKT